MNLAIKTGASRWALVVVFFGAAILALLPAPMLMIVAMIAMAAGWLYCRSERMAALWQRVEAIWPLLLVLVAFFYFPYSSVDPQVRARGDYFTIYSRFVAGLSIWEMILILGFGVLFWRKWRTGDLNLWLGSWSGMPLYLVLFAIAAANGLLHVDGGPLGYGPTELSRVIIAAIPFAYFLAVFLLVVNTVHTAEQAPQAIRWLDRFVLGLVIYGAIRFVLILSGHLKTMTPFGLPIVLYDQMNLLYIPIFVIVARVLMGERLVFLNWLYLAVMLFFILCSTRRFNYVFLALGVVMVILIGLASRSWKSKTVMKFTMCVGLSVGVMFLALIITLPGFVKGVAEAMQSIDMLSKIGQQHGGNIRSAQLDNLFSNLQARPYAVLVGFGLGTKWQAIEQQPMNSMAFPEDYIRQSKGWYPQFHLPYISVLYRFGILGVSFLLIWVIFYLKPFLKNIPRIHFSQRPFYIGALGFLAIALPTIGDSPNPVMPIICGIHMGLLERLAAAAHQAQATARYDAQHHSP
jgi:hypothetical protein